ncbi:hypothetical protein B0H66DRAFT_532056 [Apodospora peruviana]|uniref:CHAT domain-containing protein n=1 Tax=Apodospora peruviana TaxID=516989 RepID=A0AAE0M8F6_9PEZI|nr:hypothetical protein B0H66DRAFT_532056 [Apodospora peruviana]
MDPEQGGSPHTIITIVQKDQKSPDSNAWRVGLTANGGRERITTLHDPWHDEQYDTLVRYLRETGRLLWHRSNYEDGAVLSDLHQQVKSYANELWTALGLLYDLNQGTSRHCEIVIREDESDRTSHRQRSIHSLQWEILEIPDLIDDPARRRYTIKILRQVGYLSATGIPVDATGPSYDRTIAVPEPLLEVHRDRTRSYKILLVIARKLFREGGDDISGGGDWNPDSDRLDNDAHFAQVPLMKIQQDFTPRIDHRGINKLWIDIVRPGSVDELRSHLQRRSKQRVFFNLVHFDLHGVIDRDTTAARKAEYKLRFTASALRPGLGHHEISTAGKVALVLAEHRIEYVVVNACWSGWPREGAYANFCRRLLKEGRYIRSVAGLWAVGGEVLVCDYLDHFYTSLLKERMDFDAAVQAARAKLRDPTRWPRQQQPQQQQQQQFFDDFNCIQFTRYPLGSIIAQKPRFQRFLSQLTGSKQTLSPPALTPASLSLSRSGSSQRSAYATPGQVMRLELLHLHLELHLTRSRILYAYDEASQVEKMIDDIKALAGLWLRTNFVSNVYIYHAKDFQRSSDVPREELPGPREARGLAKAAHIVLRMHTAIDARGPGVPEGAGRNVVPNLQESFKGLKTDENYIILVGSSQASWFRNGLDRASGIKVWAKGVCPWNYGNRDLGLRHTDYGVVAHEADVLGTPY